LQRKREQENRVEAHQVGELDLVADRVSAWVPWVRDLRWEVRLVHLGPVDAIRKPDPPATSLDRDLGELAFAGADHLQELVVGRRVNATAEAVLARYDNHGFWTSTDEAALGFPDGLVEASPD
jgi:hypothetical protein